MDKKIIQFLASFLATFLAGFLIWNVFVIPDIGIFRKYFTASLHDVAPKEGEIEEIKEIKQEIAADESVPEIKNIDLETDILEEIAEKLDKIEQQVILLQEQKKKELDEQENEEDTKDEEKKEDTQANYPKILISEIRIAPLNLRFVELYNPTYEIVDLTGWYLQRKTQNATSWSSIASSSKFAGKVIYPRSFFLVAREIAGADIISDITLSQNNSLALKNPDGEISDLVGYGIVGEFENVPAINPLETGSIGRKVLENYDEQDTDNNAADFELQLLTPRSTNIAGVVFTSSSAGSGVATSYDKILISEVQILPINQRFIELYNPNTYAVNLTGWYLQRKTKTASSWSSLVSSTHFNGKTIGSNDYFLITREESDFSGSSDMFLNITLSDNNCLALKNEKRDIVDKLGWGEANDYENLPAQNPLSGQSIKRKEPGSDTDDNSLDFVIADVPSPRRQ